VLIPVLAILACEADLTLAACALGLGLRRKRNLLTFLASGGGALGFAFAVFLVWTLWFVAPACLGDDSSLTCVSTRAESIFGLVALGALGQWAWLLAVAFCARFVSEKNPAHISG